jgi:hypothetical protein
MGAAGGGGTDGDGRPNEDEDPLVRCCFRGRLEGLASSCWSLILGSAPAFRRLLRLVVLVGLELFEAMVVMNDQVRVRV